MPCEPSAMGSMVEVLKLILQPVVENSILYGMEGLEHVLRIRVAAYHRGNSLVLTVTDNGSSKPYEGVVLHYAATDTEATGIEIQFTIIPKAESGEVDKRLVSLQAGDELDIIYGTNAQLKVFYDAGVLSPLDESAAAASYDAPAVFGGSIPYYDDGRMYGLPAFNDVWCTFVNTKIFENAGVEVPSAEGWTWEKYVETAKKLTDVNNEIYGSLMLDYDCYNYMYALQKGAEHYKADGTSNYDDPLFAESVKFFYGLGNEEKIQPDITTYKAGVYPWNAFHSTGKADANGKYDKVQFGMFVCGGWAASMLPNTEKYPATGSAPFCPSRTRKESSPLP